MRYLRPYEQKRGVQLKKSRQHHACWEGFCCYVSFHFDWKTHKTPEVSVCLVEVFSTINPSRNLIGSQRFAIRGSNSQKRLTFYYMSNISPSYPFSYPSVQRKAAHVRHDPYQTVYTPPLGPVRHHLAYGQTQCKRWYNVWWSSIIRTTQGNDPTPN